MKKIICAMTLMLLVAFESPSQETSIHTANDGLEPSSLFTLATRSLEYGNRRVAQNTFDDIVKFYQQTGRLTELPETYFWMGLVLALNENYHKSIRYHKKAIRAHKKYKRNDNYDEIVINLALTYGLSGRQRKSDRLLSRLSQHTTD